MKIWNLADTLLEKRSFIKQRRIVIFRHTDGVQRRNDSLPNIVRRQGKSAGVQPKMQQWLSLFRDTAFRCSPDQGWGSGSGFSDSEFEMIVSGDGFTR